MDLTAGKHSHAVRPAWTEQLFFIMFDKQKLIIGGVNGKSPIFQFNSLGEFLWTWTLE